MMSRVELTIEYEYENLKEVKRERILTKAEKRRLRVLKDLTFREMGGKIEDKI